MTIPLSSHSPSLRQKAHIHLHSRQHLPTLSLKALIAIGFDIHFRIGIAEPLDFFWHGIVRDAIIFTGPGA